MEIAGALPGASPVTGELSERDRAILAFERQWWKFAGAKEQAIRELFDMSATRYYQVLNALLDRPDALAADPMLVKRLRRHRSASRRAPPPRRLGIEVCPHIARRSTAGRRSGGWSRRSVPLRPSSWSSPCC